MRLLVTVGAVVALLVPAAASAADGPPIPWDITPTTPIAEGVFAPIASPVQFEFKSAITGMGVLSIEVSTQNIPGKDGSLADDFQVDYFLPTESDAYPGTYRGVSHGGLRNWWTNVPGTYYWQATGDCYTGCSAVTKTQIGENPANAYNNITYYQSPVFTYTIAAPQPVVAPVVTIPTQTQPTTVTKPRKYVLKLVIAVRRAKAYVKSHRNARNPTAKCSRVRSSTAVCTVRWKSRGHKRSARLDVYLDSYGYTVQQH